MNIISIMKIAIFSILTIGSYSLAEVKCDYSFPSIKLCSSEVCPADYHVCNSFDKQIIIDNVQNDYFNNITDTYYTNIDTNGETCNPSSNNNNVISITNVTSSQYEHTCNYNNKIIKYGEGVLINKCIFCTCGKDSSKCINTCKYSKYLTETLQYKQSDHNALNTNDDTEIKCQDMLHINKIACCKNNNCKMPHCVSCMSYGYNEVCNVCEANHYFNRHYRSRCYTANEVDMVCDGFYDIDERQQEFKCMKCIHGSIQDIGNNKQCVCDKGYYGVECTKSYNKIKCMDNGVYNTMTRTCDCYDGYSGYKCQYNSIHACEHGTYNSQMKSCICQPGYFGSDCSQKIDCVYGSVVENICICNDRFSGKDCSIPRPETRLQKQVKETHLNSYFKKRCKYGVFNNDTETCDCMNGYNGNDCSISKCINGMYNSLLNICECIENYYGEKCELSCLEECNYNGNMCNYRKTCNCVNGWYGKTCDKIHVDDASILIGNTLEVSVKKGTTTNIVTNSTFDFEMIHCYTDNCIPFMLTIGNDETTRNGHDAMRPQTRLRRQLNSDDEDNTIVVTIPASYVNETIEAIYVYPNNNYSLSYYGGTSNIVIQNATTNTYYFMIEPIRTNDTETHNENVIYEFTTDNTINTNDTIHGNQTTHIDDTTYETDDYNTDDLIEPNTIIDNVSNETLVYNSSVSNITNYNDSTTEIDHQTPLSQLSNSENDDTTIPLTSNTYLVIGVCFGFACIITITLFVLRRKKYTEKTKQRQRKKQLINNKTKQVVYTMNSMYFNQPNLSNSGRV
jgi:hypothetical protein